MPQQKLIRVDAAFRGATRAHPNLGGCEHRPAGQRNRGTHVQQSSPVNVGCAQRCISGALLLPTGLGDTEFWSPLSLLSSCRAAQTLGATAPASSAKLRQDRSGTKAGWRVKRPFVPMRFKQQVPTRWMLSSKGMEKTLEQCLSSENHLRR